MSDLESKWEELDSLAEKEAERLAKLNNCRAEVQKCQVSVQLTSWLARLHMAAGGGRADGVGARGRCHGRAKQLSLPGFHRTFIKSFIRMWNVMLVYKHDRHLYPKSP